MCNHKFASVGTRAFGPLHSLVSPGCVMLISKMLPDQLTHREMLHFGSGGSLCAQEPARAVQQAAYEDPSAYVGKAEHCGE